MKPVIYIFMVTLLLAACETDRQEKTIIHTDSAPAAIGPYSQAVFSGEHLYLAGQIPIDPGNGKIVEGGIGPQTHRVLKNIRSVLRAAGMELEDVVQVQIYLTDMDNYQDVNKIYAEYFVSSYPARAVVEVSRLPKDVLIEVMATAVKGN